MDKPVDERARNSCYHVAVSVPHDSATSEVACCKLIGSGGVQIVRV
jgi:hypothetical protein